MLLASTWLQMWPLSVRDGVIVDASGNRFPLRAVNWYGASDVNHCVGGLDVQNVDVIAESIAQMGFRAVRLPFSNELLRADTRVKEGFINAEVLSFIS